MIEKVKQQVIALLCKDNTGHGFDHIERVLKLALKFCKKENANQDIVSLIALLHDVDDYKLVGKENAQKLINSRRIMDEANVPFDIQEIVLKELACIGYSNLLKGNRPSTKEGMISSDADMCDAIGVNGILRTYQYSFFKNEPFFIKDVFPVDTIDPEEYTTKGSATSVCHMFEKLLKLKDLMITKSGYEEAIKRHQIIVDFLYQFFEEEDVPEWKEYLDKFKC